MARIWKVVAALVGAVTALIAAVLLWPHTVSRRRGQARPERVVSVTGSRVRRLSDGQVSQRVEAALEAACGEAAARLTIKSDHGVVTLRGEVEHIDDIASYDNVVRAVAGVRDVDNLLRLRETAEHRPRILTA